MHDDRDLPRFFLRLALVGSPPEVMRQAVPDLQEELNWRDYLLNPRVIWDAGEARIVVEVVEIGRELQQTADYMAEELCEIASATLGDFDYFRVEILSLSSVENAEGAH
jgi:hypothetical protein